MKIRATQARTYATTLAEVVIAIAVVSVIGAGVLGGVGYGYRAMQALRENQRATQILVEKAETLRLYSWDQINSNGFISPTFEAPYDPQAAVGAQGVIYQGTITIAEFPGGTTYAPDMRLVTINLDWASGSRAMSKSLVTSVAKDGIQNYVW